MTPGSPLVALIKDHSPLAGIVRGAAFFSTVEARRIVTEGGDWMLPPVAVRW